MLPSRGAAHAVLLLCYAARLTPRRNFADWVRAARDHGGFVAAATDLQTPAKHLLAAGLAEQAESIALAPQLTGLAQTADDRTLRHVARVLLIANPPAWLRFVVSPGGVSRQYIPTDDLQALKWLEPELDDILLTAYRGMGGTRDSQLRKIIGDAAEAVVLAALRAAGRNPTHVAPISDAFGYDIELSGPPMQRIEVKGCSANSRGSFHLSRNEFNKSRSYGGEWVLTQVVFANAAFVSNSLEPRHVVGIYEVDASEVSSAVPPDTAEFAWTESAFITISPDVWHPARYAIAEVVLPGLARFTSASDT